MLFLVMLLAHHALGQRPYQRTIPFNVANADFLAFLEPRAFTEAVTSCAESQLTLLPFALMPNIYTELLAGSPDIARDLATSLKTANTNQAEQLSWNLWAWDEFRMCRGVKFEARDSNNPDGYFLTSDRPCSWRMSYICMAEDAALAAGLTSASAWYRRYSNDPNVASPYARGPEGSGLRLISSSFMAGGSTLPYNFRIRLSGNYSNPEPGYVIRADYGDFGVAFNDSELFWSRGPVVSGMFSEQNGGDHKLLSLRLLREADAESGWAMRKNHSSVTGKLGFDTSAMGRDPSYRTGIYNVEPNHDYIVAVQGCFRLQEKASVEAHDESLMERNDGIASDHLEMLFFITRTGRQYQFGRGGCTTWFREDAPPGGYLAGMAGWYMNTSRWRSLGLSTAGMELVDLPWIRQVQMVWAAPHGSAPPMSVSHIPPTAPMTPCLRATTMAAQYELHWAPICGPGRGMCPSNTCCGEAITTNDPRPQFFRTCAASKQSCQLSCHVNYGLCSVIPEEMLIMFVGSAPLHPQQFRLPEHNASGTTVYQMKTGEQLSYSKALDYCRASTYMGFSWSMISVGDATSWFTSMGTRQQAYSSIAAIGYFWVGGGSAIDLPNSTCIRATYGVQYGDDQSTNIHMFQLSPCVKGVASVICKASSAQTTSPRELQGAAAAAAPATWAPGPHNLTLSLVLAGLRESTQLCPASKRTEMQVVGSGMRNESSARGTEELISGRITAIGVSIATQVAAVKGAVDAVAALQVFREDLPSPTTAGSSSDAGWHVFELDAGEVVAAVSGCFGGFVERLVFHTNHGRMWTTPFLATSVCSASFMELAPPGGYLVGMQGYFGGWLESVQLVWGTPPPAPPPLASSTPADTTNRLGLVIAVTTGGVASLVLLGGLAYTWRRRWGRKRSNGSTKANFNSADKVLGQGPALLVNGGHGNTSHKGCRDGTPASSAIIAVNKEATSRSYAGSNVATSPPASGPSGAKSARISLDRDGTCSTRGGSSVMTCVIDIEEKLSAYEESLTACVRVGEAGGYVRNAGKDSVENGAYPTAVADNTKLDIATAISRLHAEMSGRQEQLHITTVLGQGSFGIVYLGTWRGLRVAVKTLVVHDALVGPEGRKRHRAILEAAISKSLQHPHIVSTYAAEVVEFAAVDVKTDPRTRAPHTPPTEVADSDKCDDFVVEEAHRGAPNDVYKLYIIQEYCNVGSLSSALGAGVIGSVSLGGATALFSLTLALDIACGMSHIHSKNIVHGDLSASNVLLSSCCHAAYDNSGTMNQTDSYGAALRQPLQGLWRPPVVAKVSDFGLSVRMLEGQTHASNCFQGTPAYSAPEVVFRGHLSKAADVWAFGVLLLELCHGDTIALIRSRTTPLWRGLRKGDDEPLLNGGTARNAAAGSVAGLPTWAVLPSDYPLLLSDLVSACFSKEPSQRPTFMQVVETLVKVLLRQHQYYRDAVLEPATCKFDGGSAADGSRPVLQA